MFKQLAKLKYYLAILGFMIIGLVLSSMSVSAGSANFSGTVTIPDTNMMAIGGGVCPVGDGDAYRLQRQ